MGEDERKRRTDGESTRSDREDRREPNRWEVYRLTAPARSRPAVVSQKIHVVYVRVIRPRRPRRRSSFRAGTAWCLTPPGVCESMATIFSATARLASSSRTPNTVWSCPSQSAGYFPRYTKKSGPAPPPRPADFAALHDLRTAQRARVRGDAERPHRALHQKPRLDAVQVARAPGTPALRRQPLREDHRGQVPVRPKRDSHRASRRDDAHRARAARERIRPLADVRPAFARVRVDRALVVVLQQRPGRPRHVVASAARGRRSSDRRRASASTARRTTPLFRLEELSASAEQCTHTLHPSVSAHFAQHALAEATRPSAFASTTTSPQYSVCGFARRRTTGAPRETTRASFFPPGVDERLHGPRLGFLPRRLAPRRDVGMVGRDVVGRAVRTLVYVHPRVSVAARGEPRGEPARGSVRPESRPGVLSRDVRVMEGVDHRLVLGGPGEGEIRRPHHQARDREERDEREARAPRRARADTPGGHAGCVDRPRQSRQS